MSDLQAIADRVEIETLRGEFTDAVMMRDYDRVASLFTPCTTTAISAPRTAGGSLNASTRSDTSTPLRWRVRRPTRRRGDDIEPIHSPGNALRRH